MITCKISANAQPQPSEFVASWKMKNLILKAKRQARLKSIKEELRRRMHEPIPEQGRWLGQVLRGYFAYHAVPTNNACLQRFKIHVTRFWRRTLLRRGQKDVTSWVRISKLAKEYLPAVVDFHPWPQDRFVVNHPRWEPGARIAPAGIYAGGAQ